MSLHWDRPSSIEDVPMRVANGAHREHLARVRLYATPIWLQHLLAINSCRRSSQTCVDGARVDDAGHFTHHATLFGLRQLAIGVAVFIRHSRTELCAKRVGESTILFDRKLGHAKGCPEPI